LIYPEIVTVQFPHVHFPLYLLGGHKVGFLSYTTLKSEGSVQDTITALSDKISLSVN